MYTTNQLIAEVVLLSPRPLILLCIGALLLAFTIASVFVFSREKGENYVTLQGKAAAQTSGRDPCNNLKEWLASAKRRRYGTGTHHTAGSKNSGLP